MPKQKGPGAIKHIHATQDDVAMRNILWRGDASHERKLNELSALAVEKLKLQGERDYLRARLNAGGEITLQRAKAERDARIELRKIESKLASVEIALRNAQTDIQQTL